MNGPKKKKVICTIRIQSPTKPSYSEEWSFPIRGDGYIGRNVAAYTGMYI